MAVGDIGVCDMDGGGVDVSIFPITVDKLGGLLVTIDDICGAVKIGGLVEAIEETSGVNNSGCLGLLLFGASGAVVLLAWAWVFVKFAVKDAFELDDEDTDVLEDEPSFKI